MKELYLNKLHKQAGARFGVFANTNMPIMYREGVLQEHLHTRSAAGLFDISHMKLIEVAGDEATNFLEHCLPASLEQMPIKKNQYSFFLNERAGIIDDLIISKLSTNKYYIVVNAANAEKDFAHLVAQQQSYHNVKITQLKRVILALQGPKAVDIMICLGLEDANNLSFMQSYEFNDLFITRSGYTGEDGFEIAVPIEQAELFTNKILEVGIAKWAGLAARDSLRLEAGLCLHGQDINTDISPVEAGLLWAIPKPLRDGAAKYIGAKALADFIENKPAKIRCGFLPVGQQPVRAGAIINNKEGYKIGEITSGGYGPSIKRPIAMGYIERSYKVNFSQIYAYQRGKQIELQLTTLPFVEHNYYNDLKNIGNKK